MKNSHMIENFTL